MDMVHSNQRRAHEGGNIFTFLFGAVAVVGIVTAVSMQLIAGPIKTASRVNAKNMTEAQMITAGRIMVIDAAKQTNNGDIDTDGFVEPREYTTVASGGVTGGGSIPLAVGASRTDPWGTLYAYCVWDAGPIDNGKNDAGSGSTNRLNGANNNTDTVIALISAGPDKVFQTTCYAFDGSAPEGVVTTSPSDDTVIKYSYAEALASAAGLWAIKAGVADTATIGKSLEVTDPANSNTVTASINKSTGVGDFLGITTDLITAKTGGDIALTGKLGIGPTSTTPATSLAVETATSDDGIVLKRTTGQVLGSMTYESSGSAGRVVLYGNGSSKTYLLAGSGNYISDKITLGFDNYTTMGVGNKVSLYGATTVGGGYHTVAAPTNGMIIEGDVGIGDSNPSTKLTVNGTVTAVSVVQTSDARKKDHVESLSDSLSQLNKLRPVSYLWKAGTSEAKVDKGTHFGFLAQEVEAVFPNLVKGTEAAKTLEYNGLIAPMVRAIQELDARNKALESRLDAMEKRLSRLESQTR